MTVSLCLALEVLEGQPPGERASAAAMMGHQQQLNDSAGAGQGEEEEEREEVLSLGGSHLQLFS